MEKVKLIAAAVATVAIAMFLFRNMGNQVRLRLFSEFEVNALTLMGLSFFAGVASVILFTLWRNWRAEKQKAGKKQAKGNVNGNGYS